METERLILRKARPTDLQDVYQMRNSEFVLKYNAMKPLSYDALAKRLKQQKPT